MAVREPLGVIACVIPFNFPCWSFSVKTAAALAAGNAVIVKPFVDWLADLGGQRLRQFLPVAFQQRHKTLEHLGALK